MDKKALLTNRVELNTGTVDIEGVGTVTVRGLTRFELALMVKKHPDDNLKQERFILATGLVDPALTEDEVEVWQKAATLGEIGAVSKKINELSGVGEMSAKEAYKSAPDGPDAQV
jgi:hypothetical protein